MIIIFNILIFSSHKAHNFYPQNRIFRHFYFKMTRDQAKAIIENLVERFREHRKDYHLNIYIEIDSDDTIKFKKEEVYQVDKKILIRRVGSDLQATIDKNQFWNLNTIYNVQLKNEDYEFILGIFNSNLISFWFKNRFAFEDKLFPYARVSQLETIPFPKNTNKNLHDEIVKYVELLLKLNEEIKSEKLQTKIEQIKQRINHSEGKINQLVYELYNLNEADIKIIEEAKNK